MEGMGNPPPVTSRQLLIVFFMPPNLPNPKAKVHRTPGESFTAHRESLIAPRLELVNQKNLKLFSFSTCFLYELDYAY
jgi:hypothetical protein